jgi:hypothetical protein
MSSALQHTGVQPRTESLLALAADKKSGGGGGGGDASAPRIPSFDGTAGASDAPRAGGNGNSARQRNDDAHGGDVLAPLPPPPPGGPRRNASNRYGDAGGSAMPPRRNDSEMSAGDEGFALPVRVAPAWAQHARSGRSWRAGAAPARGGSKRRDVEGGGGRGSARCVRARCACGRVGDKNEKSGDGHAGGVRSLRVCARRARLARAHARTAATHAHSARNTHPARAHHTHTPHHRSAAPFIAPSLATLTRAFPPLSLTHSRRALTHAPPRPRVNSGLEDSGAEDDEYQVIDRASCCWRSARGCALLFLLCLNNFLTAVCGAYLARSKWFDSWFNGTPLSALSARLAVTVPRCANDALGLVAVNSTNATAAALWGANASNATVTSWVAAPRGPRGTLLADSGGRVCGFF